MNMRFEPARGLSGELRAPADKSISHRAALLGAMASEPVRIEHYLHAADTTSTLEAVRALGALVEVRGEEVVVRGTGLREAREPERARSTSATPARCCDCCPAGWPRRRGAPSRSTATSRSAAARSTGSPSRCARWAPSCEATRRALPAASPSTARACTRSPTSWPWPAPRSSPACCSPRSPPTAPPPWASPRAAATTPSACCCAPASRSTATAATSRSSTPTSCCSSASASPAIPARPRS